MNRRTFLRQSSGGTIAGLLAFGALADAAKGLVARLFRREPSYDEWNVGFMDCLSSSTLHRVDTSTFPAWTSAASDERGEMWISGEVIDDMVAAS